MRGLEATYPPSWHVTTIEANTSSPLPDVQAAVTAALASPLYTLPLRQMARRTMSVCIVFTDATQACPDKILVPALLRELALAGVPEEHITLLCATGMHPSSTFEEKIAKLGADVALRYQVMDHDAHNPASLANLGTVGRPHLNLPADVPVFVNRLAAEADLLVATGSVEPHPYAGYSGGGKNVVIGCGGEATISVTHSPAFLDDPRMRLGRVAANPYQAVIREGAKRAGLDFVVNVVMDADRQMAAVQAGNPVAVHEQLVASAMRLFEVPVPHQYDVVVAGVTTPRDENLYQAVRAPIYVGLSPTPVVREGGVVITSARCPEGPGRGPHEQRFFDRMSQASDLNALLSDLRQCGIQAGEQRAYTLAQVLVGHTVIIVGAECPDVVRDCKMVPAATMDEAVSIARRTVGDQASALVLPHALQTLPVVGGY